MAKEKVSCICICDSKNVLIKAATCIYTIPYNNSRTSGFGRKNKPKGKKKEAKHCVIGEFLVDLDSCKINNGVLESLYGTKKSFDYDPEIFRCVIENDRDSGVKTCVYPDGLVTAWVDNGTEKLITQKLKMALQMLVKAYEQNRAKQKI
jgi:hypothetical protein